jgi:hypothetical protein
MPRLSLYRQNKTSDYKFLDRTIAEMYTVGGIDIFIHKYLGPTPTGDATIDPSAENYDATQPGSKTADPTFIEDLLLLENRDRSYDPDVYQMRGVYNIQDIDFDLSQFGLFMQQDTLFVTFHYNNMIDTFGRKLMSGDVIEVPNLKDYHPLDESIQTALPKLYTVQDASFASEGFSQTWHPHLWRIKATPLVGSQEYKDVLDVYANPADVDGNICDSVDSTNITVDIDTFTADDYSAGTISDLISTHNRNTEINKAIVDQAVAELPVSGYDVSKFYIEPVGPDNVPDDNVGVTVDSDLFNADSDMIRADKTKITPAANGWLTGYLTGNSLPPNGLPVTPGTVFPPNALIGDYVLRLDYFPNRLFRYDGNRWIKVEDNVRTNITPGASDNKTQRSKFVNNTGTFETKDRGNIPTLQGLSDLLKPSADN